MAKIRCSIWQSLDGVVDANSFDKWFTPFDSESRGSCINEIIKACDSMLYGRKTYQMLESYWSQCKKNEFGIADKLNNTKKYLVSNSLKQANWGETQILNGNFLDRIKEIKKNSSERILVQGSFQLVNSLLKTQLVDELSFIVNPFIVGVGDRAFNTPINSNFVLNEEKKLDNGVLFLTYAYKNS